MTPSPRTPASLSSHARACLDALAASHLAGRLSLGGAFGLAYYHDYRATADVDAWWSERAGREERRAVVDVLSAALGRFGPVRVRAWGDVTSVELLSDARVTFSFQIAARSARLREPVEAPWPEGARLDHFDDLLASKMEALVSRGAPRDFRDVHEVCICDLSAPEALWRLWAERRMTGGEEADRQRAALAVRTHLERIERARPLESIGGLVEREEAQSVRHWVREELLRGMV